MSLRAAALVLLASSAASAQVLESPWTGPSPERSLALGASVAGWDVLHGFALNPALLARSGRPGLEAATSFGEGLVLPGLSASARDPGGLGLGFESTWLIQGSRSREAHSALGLGLPLRKELFAGGGLAYERDRWGSVPAWSLGMNGGLLFSPLPGRDNLSLAVAVRNLGAKRRVNGDPLGTSVPARAILGAAWRPGARLEWAVDLGWSPDPYRAGKLSWEASSHLRQELESLPLGFSLGGRWINRQGWMLAAGFTLRWGESWSLGFGRRPASPYAGDWNAVALRASLGRPRLGLVAEAPTFKETLSLKAWALHGPFSKWTLRVEDDTGIPLRTMGGTLDPPPALDWDGRDDQGRELPDGSYLLTLEVRDRSDRPFHSESVRVWIDRTGPLARIAARPQLLKLGEVLPELLALYPGAADPSGIGSWTAYVLDAAGKLVQFYRGQDAPPTEILWKDGLERSALLHPGEIYNLALRVEDSFGNPTTVRAPGFGVTRAKPSLLPSSARLEERGVVVSVGTGPLAFRRGSAELLEGAWYTLDRVAEVMERYPELAVSLEGHAEEGEELSRERAQAAADYLMGDRHIDIGRIRLLAWGNSKPLAPAGSPGSEEKNNRVEIIMGVTEDYAAGHALKFVEPTPVPEIPLP